MVLKDAGIQGIRKPFGEVESAMKQIGFVRWAWDYHYASFDMKFEGEESDYYLRVQANVVEGRLENPKAVVELDNPVFARHIFPHGLDTEAEIPESFKDNVNKAVEKIKEALA